MLFLKTTDKDFESKFAKIRARGAVQSEKVQALVEEIIAEVRKRGDAALREYTQRFDGHDRIEVPSDLITAAANKVPADIMEALRHACRRIEDFHQRQKQQSWIQTNAGGEILGQLVRPLERVGIYVPGGRAVYPSSVLMNAIPARVAGVDEIIMVSPGSSEGVEPVILAAAELCGIRKIFQIGGAQAIAALTCGTKTVPRVDKITGPGNIYVATAKRLVYGEVDIDMVAGPSEILIISDGSGDPGWAAADMLSQAEHDELASAVLITTDEIFARSVVNAVEAQLAELPKKEIAAKSIGDYGAVIVAASLQEAAALSNSVAPEHLELYVQEPWEMVTQVRNAGAVFLGHHTPEPVGDYLAGPNHVLPTGGTARFYSPLSVDDFVKKTSLLSFSKSALKAVGNDVLKLARSEGLEAHARSVEKRII